MRAFLIRCLLFTGVAFLAYAAFTYYLLPPLLVRAYGMSVEQQIEKSFANARSRNYDLLIMGNSKFYCGVNPEYFSMPAYNFSHNNDNYNQIYHKLLWLDKEGKKFKYLVLGTDYFQFNFISDTRNYVYEKYLGEAYLADYPKKKLSLATVKNELQFLKPYKLKTLLQIPYIRHDLKDNGQFVRRGSPGEADFQERRFKFLDVQVASFDKVLDYCKKNQITVFICMPPLQKVEYDQYSPEQLQEFRAFIASRLSPDIFYLDFSTGHSFKQTDFIDMSHLSQEGSIELAKVIDRRISELVSN
jgi:hypothetical protein